MRMVRRAHHKKYQKVLLGSLILIGLLSFNLAYAGLIDTIVPCGREGTPVCDLCHLWELASNIINFISFNLALPLAVFLFVISGLILLFSGGVEERIKLAKSIFTNVIIGIAIIFVSWLFIDTLIKTIATEETGVGYKIKWSWNVFPTCSPDPDWEGD